MKLQIPSRPLWTTVACMALAFSALAIAAQESTPSTSAPAARTAGTGVPKSVSPTGAEFSYGVQDVVKLSQAKISEGTIVTFVETSGRNFAGLSTAEIVYLHEKGVSDRVITTMLEQRNKLMPATAPAQPAAVTSAAAQPVATVQAPQPTVTYVQPAPASTVYVFGASSPRSVDYGHYYPSYRSYGYSYPSLSFSYGFGGGYRNCGYYGGGFRGGVIRSGGFHGGSHVGFRGGVRCR